MSNRISRIRKQLDQERLIELLQRSSFEVVEKEFYDSLDSERTLWDHHWTREGFDEERSRRCLASAKTYMEQQRKLK